MAIQTVTKIDSDYTGDFIEIHGNGELKVNFDGFQKMDITPNSYRDRAKYLREISAMFEAAAAHVERSPT